MDQVMDVEKLNEFNFLKEDVEEVGEQSQSLGNDKRRLVHLTEFLKNPYDVCEFIIFPLSLNVTIEEIYQVIFG